MALPYGNNPGPPPRGPIGMPQHAPPQHEGIPPQPNSQLAAAMDSLREAIQNEPEPADKQQLEHALEIIAGVDVKNKSIG